MRSGGCAVQQELAGDAAAVMRQAVTLARRRGHAQVTPLHAASAMLADAGGGLLRAACLRSRASSHPLQCKALELCFNVALNRLATAAAGGSMYPSFHAHHRAPPALSNALAAAFKRAQANQRRGGGGAGVSVSPEGGQHGSAARVELEQLVISILDDPGVSRVMREAGFSSAEVKANVEKAAATMVSSSSPEQSSNTAASSTTASPNNNPKHNSFLKANKAAVDAAARVLECMASGMHRCVAVVGESAEAVVKAVMDRVSKGGGLKHAQFVPFSAASFQGSPREEVAARAADQRALVREAQAAGKGVVLVLQDLAYAAASWGRSLLLGGRAGYCPVEHALMELGGLVRSSGGHDMFWLLGFGSCATYASCRSGQPSLEAVLDLHPVVVPDSGRLGGDSEITHCGADMVVAKAATVPSWMIPGCQQQGPVLTKSSELTLSFSSPASSSLGGGFSHGHYYDASMMSCEPWHDLTDHHHQPLPNHGHDGPIMAPGTSCDQRLLLANPNNPGSSTSVSKSNSSDGATAAHHHTAEARRRRRKFTELTAENLKILCCALESRVPRHREIAPAIASAVLRRRSGVTRTARPSQATWLLFRGRDSDGKAAMARELARLVFGSYAEFTCIAGSNSSDSGLKRKRSPDNAHGGGYWQRFYEAIRENPHRVVMIDAGADQNDSVAAGIKDAMATGTVRGCDGDVVSLEDAMVVMSCDDQGFESRSRVSSPRPVKQQRVMTSDVDGKVVEDDGAEKAGAVQVFSLDLNACAAMDGEEGMSSSPNDMEILKAVDGVFFFQC
ncbi:unnamed protein product [Urochloa decumbens]|uniref:Clp R domain-containing protein n=1 Tax=Urochloa decumbens TaxID=240449 RepID=A0ABC8W8D7_9POAL